METIGKHYRSCREPGNYPDCAVVHTGFLLIMNPKPCIKLTAKFGFRVYSLQGLGLGKPVNNTD